MQVKHIIDFLVKVFLRFIRTNNNTLVVLKKSFYYQKTLLLIIHFLIL